MLIAVNYHYVRPSYADPYPGIFGVTTDEFRDQMERLGRAGEFVSAGDVLAAARGERSLPSKAILVTFDGGLREHLEHAWPVLGSLGIPGMIFVNTRPIAESMVLTAHQIHLLRASTAPAVLWELMAGEAQRQELVLDSDGEESIEFKYLLNCSLKLQEQERLVSACFRVRFGGVEEDISRLLYLSRKDLRELGRAGAIGSHAHDHLPLGLLSGDELTYQLAQSSVLLAAWTGRPPAAIGYPYGTPETVTAEVVHCAGGLGFEIGFTTEMAGNSDQKLAKDPLLLARYDANHLPGGKAALVDDENLFRAAPNSQKRAGRFFRQLAGAA